MSSVLRSKAATPTENTRWVNITTPSYFDASMRPTELDGTFVPVPFTVNNGVLDINIQDDVIESLFNDPLAFYYDQVFSPTYKVKLMGGSRPVTSLGPNLTEFLYYYLDANDESLAIQTAPVMTKIQSTYNIGDGLVGDSIFLGYPYGFIENTLGSGTPMGTSISPPQTDYVTGTGVNDNYRTSWVFKTPLTVQFTSSGSPLLYFTFSTNFDVPAVPVIIQSIP